MDLARNVFIAVHVDDLIMVGSSSQLYEVVGEMKQYFTMKVTHPLSASSTQTSVGARYLRHGDAIWELPTARYVTGMLNEDGMKDAKPVVTLAVNRNEDDDEDEEASAEEHRILRRIVGKSQFLAPRRQTLPLLRTVWRGPWQNLQNRTSLRRSVSCDICGVRRISD